MKTSIASFLLGFAVAVWLTPLVRRWAVRFQLVDKPEDGRRVNHTPIPRAGGLAIAAGVLAPILGLAFYENAIGHAIYDDMIAVLVLLVGALASLGVGLADDLVRPSAKLRLLALIGIATLSWFGGYRIDEAVLPWVGHVSLGQWSYPMTVLWIVGVIVAFNFVDGLDGLATGIALICTATLFVYAQIDQNVLWMTWTGAMAGALLGFLVFNFNPASIFMGDAGSNFLGYLLAVVALQTSRKGSTAVALLVPMCVLGLPLLDTALTIVRRTLLRQGLFTSERGHLHHRLLRLGLSHRQAVLVLYGVTAVLCLGAMSISVPFLQLQILIAVLIAAVMFGLMFATGYIRPRDLAQMYLQGRLNDARQQQIEEVCQDLARSMQSESGPAVEVPQVLERLVERGCVTAVQYRCEHGCEAAAGSCTTAAKGARLMVQGGRARAATVRFFWQDRTVDPSPRESAALGKLFEGLECSCAAAVALRSSGGTLGDLDTFRKMHSRPAASAQLAKVWDALVESAEKLSLLRIELKVDLPGLAEGFSTTWEKDTFEESEKSWRFDVPVMSENRVVGWLRVIGDASRASNRQDIASVLDVLETSEAYLKSVFRSHDQVPVTLAVAGPHSEAFAEKADAAAVREPN